MIKITLSGKRGIGQHALIDDEFRYLAEYTWHVNDKGYVVGWVNGKIKRLHRLVTDEPKGMDVDHKYGDKLDNRLESLRICEHRKNCYNNKLSLRNKSGFKGVYKRKNTWKAVIQYDGKLRHLGTFDSIEQAIQVRLKAEKQYFGDYARQA